MFVYGTLKRGYPNHEGYCTAATGVKEAAVRGALYSTLFGFPVLELPEEEILYRATGDYREDRLALERIQAGLAGRDQPPGSGQGPFYGRARGELLYFSDSGNSLAAIDRLEGFLPGGESLYTRVIAAVRPAGGGEAEEEAAWVYVADPAGFPGAQPLPGGLWKP